jgi:hypothetical protein
MFLVTLHVWRLSCEVRGAECVTLLHSGGAVLRNVEFVVSHFGEAQTVKLKCCLHSRWDSPCCQIANNCGAVMCTVCFNFIQLAVPLCSRTPRCCLFFFGLVVEWGGRLFCCQHAQLNSIIELPVCIITFIVHSWNAGVVLFEISNLWLDSFFVPIMLRYTSCPRFTGKGGGALFCHPRNQKCLLAVCTWYMNGFSWNLVQENFTVTVAAMCQLQFDSSN